MPITIELVPGERMLSSDLFKTEIDYAKFRESFISEVLPEQERWLEIRRQSEEESRVRLLR